MTREELITEINRTREEMRTAGPIHRRDLVKHLARIKAELRRYDRYGTGAKQGVE
jgi:hypothetical protein